MPSTGPWRRPSCFSPFWAVRTSSPRAPKRSDTVAAPAAARSGPPATGASNSGRPGPPTPLIPDMASSYRYVTKGILPLVIPSVYGRQRLLDGAGRFADLRLASAQVNAAEGAEGLDVDDLDRRGLLCLVRR